MDDVAVQPRYVTAEANQRVPLHSGPLILSWDAESQTGDGEVYFDWLPYPHVGFEVELVVPFDAPDLPAAFDVELQGVAAAKPARYWQLSEAMDEEGNYSRSVTGSITGQLLIGNPAATDEVVFHVPNLPPFHGDHITFTDPNGDTTFWKGRLPIAVPPWHIVIDSVSHIQALDKQIRDSRGYGITHVGRITRDDGQAIDFNDAEDLLTRLYWFLSLVRAEQAGPLLIAGVHDGHTVWETWQAVSVAPSRGSRSWLPVLMFDNGVALTPQLSGLFEGLLDMWSEGAASQRVLTRSISWLIQSVSTSHLGAWPILAQAGLELLAWHRLVEVMGMSEDGFGKLSASDTMRLALSQASVPLAVPNSDPMAELLAAANAQPPLDGPGCVTELRNGLVHPKPNARFDSDDEMLQGGLLARHYLQLLLLHRLGYTGRITSMVSDDCDELVPWS